MERTGWLCPLPVGDLGPQQWETYNFRHHWENLSPEPREGSGSPPPSAPPRTVHQNLEGCRTISRAARRHLNCAYRPRSSGKVEYMNRTLKQLLKKFCQETHLSFRYHALDSPQSAKTSGPGSVDQSMRPRPSNTADPATRPCNQ
ncbi:uncharacterized protein LOC144339418 isoform X2 [Macaca mulatta]